MLKEKEIPELYIHAIYNKNIVILKWLLNLRLPTDRGVAIAAMCSSNREIENIIFSKCKFKLDLEFFKKAANLGCLRAVKYCHENHCPWDVFVCAHAAERNHLDVLKYLHENGCPWDKWTWVQAANRDHHEILKYILEEGMP